VAKSKIEHLHQKTFVEYLYLLERQGKIITFFAVPNGGSRNIREARNLKLEGVRAGVSDLVVVLKDKVIFIEMKQPPKKLKSGKLSTAGISVQDSQREFLGKVSQSNVCKGYIAYGFEQAKKIIEEE
jgi:hypothetical protein